ncbi:MAG: aldo/keto reductase [Armatimonadetes bacterium]|nr:aldo/keto reductase [Armatimonadota bacterium]
MEKRILGRTGLAVSAIGMGGIPIRRRTHDEAVALYRYALDRGINYFDAARGYEDCQTRLGPALKGRRDRAIIASKDGAATADKMMEAIEESLRVLETDYIDIFKLHGVCQFEDLERRTGSGGALEGLQKAREQGKIRYLGISGHNPDVLLKAVETGEFDVILVLFNYVNTEPAEGLLDACAKHNVGVTVMKPLGGSVLAQHADLALRWVLQHEPVASVCPGMWRGWEIDANVTVGAEPAPLTEAEMQVIDDQRRMRSPLFCRLCYRHRACPKGVDLNDMMIADLNYTRFGLAWLMRQGWGESVKATGQCATCDSADECRASCPHGVDIPRYLTHVHTTYRRLVDEYA